MAKTLTAISPVKVETETQTKLYMKKICGGNFSKHKGGPPGQQRAEGGATIIGHNYISGRLLTPHSPRGEGAPRPTRHPTRRGGTIATAPKYLDPIMPARSVMPARSCRRYGRKQKSANAQLILAIHGKSWHSQSVNNQQGKQENDL